MGGGKQVSSHHLREVGSIEGGLCNSTSQLTHSIGAFGKTTHIACLTFDQKARVTLAIAFRSERYDRTMV